MRNFKFLLMKISIVLIFLSCSSELNGIQKPIKILTKILDVQSYKGKVINLEYTDNLSTRYVFSENVVEVVSDTIFVENKSGDVIFNLIMTDTTKTFLKNYLEKKEGALINEY